MNRKSLYTRMVGPGGLVSINQEFYQVPETLEGKQIWINLDRHEYILASPVYRPEPIPIVPKTLTLNRQVIA